MKSINAGTKEGKPDYSYLFSDFESSSILFAKNSHRVKLAAAGRYEDLIHTFDVDMQDLLEARMYGVKKYERFNWSASICTEEHEIFLNENQASIFRHLISIINGEQIDFDGGCKHQSMIVLRCLIALDYEYHREIQKRRGVE